ncbi:MAG: hypothetical protein HC888_13515 [Candidatus Competibacteraceae bacterium]|nr:hypothetical protein [Candidatus Competibacteraceae bacterium]
MAAINELKPVLGLELTATPFVEISSGVAPFRNVVYEFPLAKAMEAGYVKEPAVVTQKDFDARQYTDDQIEKIKLEDAVRIHETTKVELETYARNAGLPVVKPFILVIARDTTHAADLLSLLESSEFFEGRYAGKVIQVDSSRTGSEEEAMITRLLAVEQPEEPTELVIHVNMLKEGWDVTNLYTVVPLRAANARTLVEQSIGRGLRLPYGKRTGVASVDRLNIIAHDRFQEIVDEANRADSVIRLQKIILDLVDAPGKPMTVDQHVERQDRSRPRAAHRLFGRRVAATVFDREADRRVAQVTLEVLNDVRKVPSVADLSKAEVKDWIVAEVEQRYVPPAELPFDGPPDIASVVAKTLETVQKKTIDIPRILVHPRGETTVGFNTFAVDCRAFENLQPVSNELLLQHLRTNERLTLSFSRNDQTEERLEDYIVRALMDCDDISYDDHSNVLYDAASQVVRRLRQTNDEERTKNILVHYQRTIADNLHAQLVAHRYENAVGYDVEVRNGFSEILGSSFTMASDGGPVDFRTTVEDKARIRHVVFGGFLRCLHNVEKFDSDTERRFAVLCDRDSLKWMKPARRQFRIYYQLDHEQLEYVPDSR